jgi:aspartate/methionine/tyrosine aminotransferase
MAAVTTPAEGNRSRYVFNVIRERMRARGQGVLDFALGSRPIPLPPEIEAIACGHGASALARCSADDSEALIEAATRMLRRTYGVELPASAILPVPGGRSAIGALTAALIEPGDAVVVTEPGYPAFRRLATQAHARPVVALLDPAREFTPDRATLDRLPAPRLIGLNYPNNPTGAVPSAEALADLAELGGAATVWFNDATYGPLTYDRPPFSLLADDVLRKAGTRVVELHSLAKLFPAGPLSTAFLAGDPPTIDAVRELSEYAWSPISSLQARIGLACLDDRQHTTRVRDELRERLTRLASTLEAVGFEPYPTHGGLYQLCRCPTAVGNEPVGGAAEAADRLLERHGLAVVPFETPPHHYLRFSALYSDEALEALAALGGEGPLVRS